MGAINYVLTIESNGATNSELSQNLVYIPSTFRPFLYKGIFILHTNAIDDHAIFPSLSISARLRIGTLLCVCILIWLRVSFFSVVEISVQRQCQTAPESMGIFVVVIAVVAYHKTPGFSIYRFPPRENRIFDVHAAFFNPISTAQFFSSTI